VVVPENAYLRLPSGTDAWDVEVSFPHDPSNGPGFVTLLSGALLQDYTVQALPQEQLDVLAHSAGNAAGTSPAEKAAGPEAGVAELPLEVPPGAACWVVPDLAGLQTGSGYFLRAAGTGLMISAGHGDDSAVPSMRGGDPGVIWLPAPMMKPQARLTLLLESRGTTAGRLDSLLCQRAHS
jgi:hypothetical protein